MKIVDLPKEFPRLSLKEKYDILSQEFLMNHSVNDLITSTKDDFITAINTQFPTPVSPNREESVKVKDKIFVIENICKLIIKQMDIWYKTDVLETIEELKLYFDTVAIPDGATLSQVDLVSVVGPHVEQNVLHYFRGIIYNKYIRNKPIKELLETKGLPFNDIKF